MENRLPRRIHLKQSSASLATYPGPHQRNDVARLEVGDLICADGKPQQRVTKCDQACVGPRVEDSLQKDLKISNYATEAR